MSYLRSKLDRVHKSVRMLNNGTNIMDKVLQMGRTTGDMRGLGFNENKIPFTDSSKFKSKPILTNQVSQLYDKANTVHTKKNLKQWICHHCSRLGYIRPLCFRLYGYPTATLPHKSNKKGSNSKKVRH